MCIRDRYGDQLGEQIIQLEHQIYEMAGEEFNINSPKQLGVILFEKLNICLLYTSLYRMAIFCNLAVFVPSITLMYREKGKTQ